MLKQAEKLFGEATLLWRVQDIVRHSYRVTPSDFVDEETWGRMHGVLLLNLGAYYCALRYMEKLGKWQYEPTRRLNMWLWGECNDILKAYIG